MLMAAEPKKDRHRAAEIQQLRRDWRSASQLRELADAMREQAARLEAFAKALEDKGGHEVYVDGVTKGDNSRKLFTGFVTNVEVGLVRKKIRKPDTRKRIR